MAGADAEAVVRPTGGPRAEVLGMTQAFLDEATIATLDTPVVVVDLDRVEARIAGMAAVMRERGVALRPHAKTHKSIELARRQLAAGAVGLTVATLGEAEVFAETGIEDLFVAYPVIANRPSLVGGMYTGAVVQYMGDGYTDPHSIYAQLDAVKYQYGCFLETFIKTGHALLAAPQPLGTPCPQP